MDAKDGMDGTPSPGSLAPRRSGTWTIVALIVVGLIPFVVSLAVVAYVRTQAKDDPKAQQWIDEHAGKTRLLGAGAGAKK